MPNVFDHLHMKKRGKGSPNELSLDVLDAARSNLDARGKAQRQQADKHAILESSMARRSFGSESPPNGKEPSGKGRTRSAIVYVAVSIAVILVVGGALIVFGAKHSAHSPKSFEHDMTDSIARLRETDSLIERARDFMSDPLAQYTQALDDELPAEAGECASLLEEMRDEMEGFSPDDADDAGLTALGHLRTDVELRIAMANVLQSTLSLCRDADEDARRANDAWMAVIDADHQVRAATARANESSDEEGVEQARGMTQEALDKMGTALLDLEELSERSEAIDLAPFKSYLRLRMSALGHAIAAEDALIEGDRETAIDENELYNSEEQEAASLAADLPASIIPSIHAGFSQRLALYRSHFDDAYDRMTVSEAAVASYLNQ